MTVTITWSITGIDAAPNVNGLANVIRHVNWSVRVSNGRFSASRNGGVDLSEHDSNSFVEFDALTEADAIAWVQSALGESEVVKLTEALKDEVARFSDGETPRPVALPWGNDI